MNNKGILTLLILGILISVVFSLNFVSAGTVKLLCLERGEILEFSKCNDLMPDRECTSNNGCQYCVELVRAGVYCPKSLNECNIRKLSCSALDTSNNEIEINNTPQNTTQQNNTNTNQNNTNQNNTNTSTNNSSNSNTDTNTNTEATNSGGGSSTSSSGTNTNTVSNNQVSVSGSTSGKIVGSNDETESNEEADAEKENEKENIIQNFFKNLFDRIFNSFNSTEENNTIIEEETENQETNKTSILDRLFNRNKNSTDEGITGSLVEENTENEVENPDTENSNSSNGVVLIMGMVFMTLLEILILLSLILYDKKKYSKNNKSRKIEQNTDKKEKIKDAIRKKENTTKAIIEAAKKEKTKKDEF